MMETSISASATSKDTRPPRVPGLNARPGTSPDCANCDARPILMSLRVEDGGRKVTAALVLALQARTCTSPTINQERQQSTLPQDGLRAEREIVSTNAAIQSTSFTFGNIDDLCGETWSIARKCLIDL